MSDEVQSLAAVDAAGLTFAVARSRYNNHITAGLRDGAVEFLESCNAEYTVVDTPGAFELPLVAQQLLAAGYDGVIALGAVVDGETDHYEHVAHRASEGLLRVMLDSGKPVAFGILTVRDEAHALTRSTPGPGNKGAEAAAAAVETALLLRDIADGDKY
jgi:6,7-dimethyl-8-ribityllumazine synthase